MNKRRAEIVSLSLLAFCAFGFRLYGAGRNGFSNDEAFKWWAIQSYQNGLFTGVNPEHPMLMKLSAWASFRLGLSWNHVFANWPWLIANLETILRLPNLVVGSLTVVVLYYFGKELLGWRAGVFAAIWWAFLPLAVSINSILKEDTLLIFFTYLAFLLFLRAKRVEEDRADWYFMLSGACFGLALASKYYLHYLGIHFLWWHAAGARGLDPRRLLKTLRRPIGFFAALLGCFVLANPVILSPANDRAILRYMAEQTLHYHGQNVNGHLYMTTFSSTPFGIPAYFYVWLLALKTPITVLAAIVAGVVISFLSDRRSLGVIFLQVMVLFYFVPLSLINPRTIRYFCDMLPFLLLAGGYAVGKWWEAIPEAPRLLRTSLLALLVAAVAVYPTFESMAIAPYFTLYLNPLGGGRANLGRFFPYDEVGDMGVKESVASLCASAAKAAVVAVNNPPLVKMYFSQCGRADIQVNGLFDPGYKLQQGNLLILQESRRYFETDDLAALVKRKGHLLEEIKQAGLVVARTYQF